MNNRRWLWLLLIGVGWALTWQPLLGQSGPAGRDVLPSRRSHLPVSSENPDVASAEALLDQQLSTAGELTEKQKELALELAQQLLRNPSPQLKKHVARLKEHAADGTLADPKLADLLAKLAPALGPELEESDPQKRPTPDQVSNALLQKAREQSLQEDPRPGPGESVPLAKPMPAPSAGKAPAKPASRPGPREPRVKPKSPPPIPRELETRAQWARQILKWAERSGLDSALARSPSWQRMVHGLHRYSTGEGTFWSSFSAHAGTPEWPLPRWDLDLHPRHLLPEGDWSLRPRLPEASFPRMHWPGGVPSWGHLPAWDTPRTGVPGAPSRTTWRGLLWVGVTLAVGLTLWRILSAHRGPGVRDHTGAPGLGAWPVDPARVATRDELIRAFEHLSLLRLGSGARTWNHLQIAAGLGDSEAADAAERRRAAAQLAALYEQARYTPPSQPLPDSALVHARRELCLLARMPAP
jgi:hypothetical protein